MGANQFEEVGFGKTAKKAFWSAVEDAQYECGHGGYTGTIAEKDSFVEIEVPEGMTPSEFVDKLLEEDDPRISNKWGPAGCVDAGPCEHSKDLRKYYFFGWASS